MVKKTFFLLPALLCSLLAACSDGTGGGGGNGDDITVKTGKVTFYNESSYAVVVHQDSFSGPVLLELTSGATKRAEVRTSDNYGVGTTFCIEYKYKVIDGADLASGEVWAEGIDPNVQLNFVVEENKSYTKTIPQPAGLEFRMAFVKIQNTSGLQFELAQLGNAYKQTGNGALSVPPGKTGVYRIEAAPASSGGKSYGNFNVVQNFSSKAVPAFSAEYNKIYNFTFDGTVVTQDADQSIVFN